MDSNHKKPNKVDESLTNKHRKKHENTQVPSTTPSTSPVVIPTSHIRTHSPTVHLRSRTPTITHRLRDDVPDPSMAPSESSLKDDVPDPSMAPSEAIFRDEPQPAPMPPVNASFSLISGEEPDPVPYPPMNSTKWLSDPDPVPYPPVNESIIYSQSMLAERSYQDSEVQISSNHYFFFGTLALMSIGLIAYMKRKRFLYQPIPGADEYGFQI